MPCYYKCIANDWKPVHDDPMIVEAAERIIAGGEPTPQIGQTYTQVGSYHKADGFRGIELKEFDWSEYEVMCSDGIVRRPIVFWNKEKFEYVGEEFIPDTYLPVGHPLNHTQQDMHVETMRMVCEFKYEIKSTDLEEPGETLEFIHDGKV